MGLSGPPSVIVTDLDGTFWHTDDVVAEPVLSAVAEIERRGVPLLVATGRRLASTVEPLSRHGLSLPMVVCNGSLGVEADGVSRFHLAPYDRAGATAVLDACRSQGADPVIQVDHRELEVFLSASPGTHPDHVSYLAPVAAVDDLDRVVAEESVLGFSLLGIDHALARRIAAAVDGAAETHVDDSIDFPGMASLTIAPVGQSKWDGVLAFCETRALDSTRVLCLADGTNDIELLDGAALRLVPDGANPAALDRADHVIAPAAAGGWASVVDHLG